MTLTELHSLAYQAEKKGMYMQAYEYWTLMCEHDDASYTLMIQCVSNRVRLRVLLEAQQIVVGF